MDNQLSHRNYLNKVKFLPVVFLAGFVRVTKAYPNFITLKLHPENPTFFH